MLQVTPVRAFTDNYSWLIHSPRDARKVAVVDPGDAAPVQRALAAEKLELAAIFLTHHHGDYIGGVAALLQDSAVPTFGPANEAIPGNPTRLREGDRVELSELGLRFDVLDVPGHTGGPYRLYRARRSSAARRSKRARDEATVPSNIRQERNVNPFLRCHQETVKHAAEARAGHRLNRTKVFAVIRLWKDGVRA